MSQNPNPEVTWKLIFEKYDILNKIKTDGLFKISANQIREFSEPRLVTKFDTSSSLPSVFKKNKISILPISRGNYILGKFDMFYSIKDCEKDFQLDYDPINYQSLNINNIVSESLSILYAYNTELLQKSFDESDLKFTLFGRMGTDKFHFNVKTESGVELIDVNKSQIEIDAGFESNDCLYIIEAKKCYVDEINLRQLYYPYRYWKNKIDKKVVPVFLIYSNKVFKIYIGKFTDDCCMNSFVVDKMIVSAMNEPVITMEDIDHIFDTTTPIKPNVTFPQANTVQNIIDILDEINNLGSIDSEHIIELFNFTTRQSSYYTTAARYLGLIESKRGIFTLTKLGDKIVKMSTRNRNLAIIRAILGTPVFYDMYSYLKINHNLPDKEYVAGLIRKYHPPVKKENSDTPYRRAEGALAWFKWILNNIE